MRLRVNKDTESVLDRAELQKWVEDKYSKNEGADVQMNADILHSWRKTLQVLGIRESCLVKKKFV